MGIPGSGKSTWAKDYITNTPRTKRINRDDLRVMLDNNKASDGNERFIRFVRTQLIRLCIEGDRDIIIDDTNCISLKLEELIEEIRDISNEYMKKINIEILDFDVSIDECIKRNHQREGNLADSVIYYAKANKDKINVNKLRVDNYMKIIN